jgi:GNAT superfamily N-acetyltransferase
MGITVEAISSAAEFLERAGSFLEAREAHHCLTLGTAGALRDDPSRAATFLVASLHGRVVATAYWLDDDAPDVLLSEVDDPGAIAALAEAVTSTTREVHAPAEDIDAFAGAIAARLGLSIELLPHGAEQRIFELTHVTPSAHVAGSLRRAGPTDRAVLIDWFAAFEAEALGGDPEPPDEWVDLLLSRPGRAVFLWEVGDRPVSMCLASGRTAHGIRFGGVYTPPELRGRGYASAGVAAASQQQLDEGRARCFLLTDLANPTANHIYEAIGYRPVRDFAWRLLR